MAKKPLELGIKRSTVTTSVADLIRQRIISGEYPGGHQVRQEAVASEIGVSRIPVREALMLLEAEGLLVIHTHRGAVVSPLTIDDAKDIFDSRLLLEPFMLKQAIEAAKPEDIAKVKAALDDYENALKAGATPAELSELNWALHTAMSIPAKRPRTLTLLQSLYSSADRYLRLQIDEASAQSRALKDHVALTDAFARRDAVAGARLLKQHIAEARNDVISGLKLKPWIAGK
jgi:DNA-binding GntR family transcriptional regulator